MPQLLVLFALLWDARHFLSWFVWLGSVQLQNDYMEIPEGKPVQVKMDKYLLCTSSMLVV